MSEPWALYLNVMMGVSLAFLTTSKSPPCLRNAMPLPPDGRELLGRALGIPGGKSCGFNSI